MPQTKNPRKIAILGPDVVRMNEASDLSVIGAALSMMGHTVVLLGRAGETSLAVERGVEDVGGEPLVVSYNLSELDSVDCAIVYELRDIQERVNDLGIIVDSNWVFIATEEKLEAFADAAVNLMALNQVVI